MHKSALAHVRSSFQRYPVLTSRFFVCFRELLLWSWVRDGQLQVCTVRFKKLFIRIFTIEKWLERYLFTLNSGGWYLMVFFYFISFSFVKNYDEEKMAKTEKRSPTLATCPQHIMSDIIHRSTKKAGAKVVQINWRIRILSVHLHFFYFLSNALNKWWIPMFLIEMCIRFFQEGNVFRSVCLSKRGCGWAAYLFKRV